MTWTHLGDTAPKARKEYTCCLCGLRIRKGARYIARRGNRDGKIDVYRMHAVCEDETRYWGEDEWMNFDAWDFRTFDLQLPLIPEVPR